MNRQRWYLVYWGLSLAFFGAAALNVLHVRAGFFTNHLADVVVPAWLYVIARSLQPGGRRTSFMARTVGRTPARAALSILAASAITEFCQRSWPHGLFPGRFDPYDLVAYGVGIGAVYLAEKSRHPSASDVTDHSSRA